MKSKLPIIVLSILCFSFVRSETLKTEVPVRLGPSEAPVLKLYEGVYVDADFPREELVRIGLVVYLNQNDFVDQDHVRKGALLINSDGVTIGEVIQNFEVIVSTKVSSGKFETFLHGFVPKSAIDSSSVPEYDLNALISRSQNTVASKTLSVHMDKYKYRDWISYDGFRSFIKFNSERLSSPAMRALLVFRDNQLFAIVHPSILVKSRLFPERIDGDNHIQYFTKDSVLIKRFEKGFYFQYKQAG